MLTLTSAIQMLFAINTLNLLKLLDTNYQLFREYEYSVSFPFCSTSLPPAEPHCKVDMDWLNAYNTIAFLLRVTWKTLFFFATV